MLKKIIYILILGVFYNPGNAADIKDNRFVDVHVKKGNKFAREGSTAYLECYDARSFPERGLALRSFYIKPKRGEFQDKIVGKIGIKYNQTEKQIEIGSLDVEEPYHRRGYGEAALRTVLGIYRSQKNNGLAYDHFWLTVGKGYDRKAARELYFKVGFQIEEDLKEIGYLNLTLKR